MLNRLMGYLKALFGFKMDQWEDPEVLLAQAQQEMKENHAKNRERAVQAVTQKNQLLAMRDQAKKTRDNLQAKAEYALKNGDRELARQLLGEKQQYDSQLTSTEESLANAETVCENVKSAIHKEEEQLRLKAAQALTMRTQWKQAQISNSIQRAMEGLQADGTDSAFKRAQERIQQASSESHARTEVSAGNLNTKLSKLDDAIGANAADAELAALEQKMGLAPKVDQAASITAKYNTGGSVEDQLKSLEQKIGG